ncbi:unnamed protein product [Prunus armeniaca]
MPRNDDFVPCTDATVPPTAASQNSPPPLLEHNTRKRKPTVDGIIRKEVEKRAKYKYCNATYASDTRKNGTSNMWKHLNKKYLHYPYRHKDKNIRILTFDASKSNALICRNFNKDDFLDACIRMVVRDELPFSFVEGEGFMEFCGVA